uniref:Protein TIME FOR COFFEE n=1 Tax=Davidia involucrata TaxID=16924 RepID=A0A5B7AP23_DAVIN
MDRNRGEVRRASMAATNGGLSRRRHRSNSLRDSPEEDGPVELHEPARLRDRGVKKDRDRDRDRDRFNRSKRRRADRLMHGSNREDGGEDSTEESVNDEEEDDDDDGGGVGGGGGAVRMLPPNPVASMSSSPMSNHHNPHRKSFPTATKVFRATPAWKAADEMIGVSVPRKARSASTKRSHECWTSGSGVGGEQIHRQASTSPVRPNLTPMPSPAPDGVSPSSSNASVRKKMKPNGPKLRPPKSSSKSSSSNPEELEIEIAEVLYGMTQSQGPSKKEIMANDSAKLDSRETNKSSSDAKSRVSSPISNSPSTAPMIFPQNSSSSVAPLSAVAPKRKRPRQVSDNLGNYSIRNSPISSTTKVEIDQTPKTEISSPNLEKTSGSGSENGGVPYDLGNSIAVPPSSEPPPPAAKPEGGVFSESKPLTEEAGESRDVVATKEEVTSPKKESPAVRGDDDRQDVTATKVSSTISETESQREEKFQIDLMAPPPQLRSSPEREGEIDFVAPTLDRKQIVSDIDAEMRETAKDKEDEAVKIGKDNSANMEPEEKKVKMMVEEAESQKPVINKERNIVLQLDLEKPDRESVTGSAIGNRVHQHVAKQQPTKVTKEEPHTEKTAQSSSLPLPMSVASWPGGLPPMGYMAPLQGVVSMDGSTISSTPLQPLFSQPRPKRCATHCYIAKNIHNFHQLMKMNPFWPAAAGSASLFGAKPGNLNVVPPAELHGNIAGRSVNLGQDKGQGLAIFPGHAGKDKGSQAANIADAAPRKQQILLQQALPPGVPPSNILGPAFIFPLSQQPAAAAASVRPGSVKSPTTTGSVASSNASSSASVSASATAAAAAAAAAVSFNYPNMPANETQYLAILQNNGYPFPIPAVGAPPSYRGTHAQAMPYFNGTFYSSQMIHPSQLQHQQQPITQPQQMQQGHQNTSISSGGSSSHKHLQSQQQRPQGSSANGGNGSGNLNSFSAPKNRPSQSPQQQQQANQHIPPLHQARQLESELGGEDSPSTADSRVSRATMSVYGQNFAMPIHPQNFALMTPPVFAGTSGGGGQSEKKQQQQPQQQGLKAGVEPLPPQTFALSFASINGATTAPGFDISSMAQNHQILQSLPEATRQYQMMAAAAQQKKNFRASEEGKNGVGDSSNVDEEKKGLAAGKASATTGQSIAFSRPNLTEASVSSISGNSVIDSSAQTLNLASGPVRTSHSAMGTGNASNSQLQAQLQHQRQQHIIQQHMAARSKAPATSNGIVYTDHLTSSSSLSANKFQNALAAFPQNLVQSGSTSSAQSPQWKNSVRTTTPQVPSSLASSNPSSLKNHPQQQSRNQQSHSQISFGASPKSSAASQGQQVPNSNQSPSPPMVVGSPTPTTSSISKGAGGSPRTTTSNSTGNKAAQPSTLLSQQTKNSPSVASRKSSPVSGRNVSSILGNPGTKSQMMQQQQIPKQALQQPQLFFSHNAYIQAQAPHSTSTSSNASATGGYYLQRRCPDQPQQQPQGSSATSSTGMLSLCTPVTLASAASTTDPAKAAAAAAAAAASNNVKGGGGLSSQGILHPQFTTQSSGNPNHHQLGFSYVQAVPAAVQVKPAEQKQPAA